MPQFPETDRLGVLALLGILQRECSVPRSLPRHIISKAGRAIRHLSYRRRTSIYILVFFPRRDSGFYSWHPVKRVLAIMFFPLVILFEIAGKELRVQMPFLDPVTIEEVAKNR